MRVGIGATEVSLCFHTDAEYKNITNKKKQELREHCNSQENLVKGRLLSLPNDKRVDKILDQLKTLSSQAIVLQQK